MRSEVVEVVVVGFLGHKNGDKVVDSSTEGPHQ